MCVGQKEKLKREEYFQRELNYNIICGWADKPPKKNIWWPIEGEHNVKKLKLPSKKQLEHFDAIFRSLGKKKHG